jgi:hypothetical protein
LGTVGFMRRPLLVVVALAGIVAGCSLLRAGPPPSPHCRGGSPLAGVYHPERLKVKTRCRVAIGTIEQVKPELYDGDIHIQLRLDRGQEGLLSEGNARVGGTLIVEIIPWDRARVLVPAEGQRVEVVGPWVDDTAHGWFEIHPAWWISAGSIEPASADELRRVDRLLHGLEPASAEDDG